MKISEKVEIVITTLAIIAIFTLLQSPLLNALSIIMAARLLYKFGQVKQLTADTVYSTVVDQSVATRTANTSCGLVSSIMQNICSMLVFVELLSLPMMVLYLISPYQAFNCVFGLIVGLICVKVIHGKIFQLIRLWVWFVTFNLSLVSIMVIVALSR